MVFFNLFMEMQTSQEMMTHSFKKNKKYPCYMALEMNQIFSCI